MLLVVILAIIAQICYALNDFSGALSARKIDGKLMTLMSWVCGTILYTAIAPFFLHINLAFLPMVVLFFLAALFTFAYPIFLKSTKDGNATVSGVIAGAFPLWSVIFSIIFFHDRPTATQGLVILVIVLGVILSALRLGGKTGLKELFNRSSLLAFLVSLMWGLGFALWKYPVDHLGWFETAYFVNVFAAIICIGLFYPALRGTVKKTFKKFYFYPIANVLTGTAATLAYSYALTRGKVSVVIPIAGSYSGLYAILSYLKFRDKLTKLQLLGISLILGGVLTLSIIISRT